MDEWKEILEIIGKVLEIYGVLLMAAKYTNIPSWEVPIELFIALFKPRRGLQMAATLTPESAKTALRGLALLVLGITLQVIPYVVTVAHSVH